MGRTSRFTVWAAAALLFGGLFLVLLMFFVEQSLPHRAEPRVVTPTEAKVPTPPAETAPWPIPEPPPDDPELEAEVEAEVERFEKAYAARRESLPEEIAEPVDENIGVIESAVADILAALANDPDNESLKRMLIATYRNELKLLKKALHLSEPEPEPAGVE